MRPPRLPWHALLRAGVLAVGVGLPVAALGYAVRSSSSPVARWDAQVIVRATDYTRTHPDLYQALIVWQEISQPRWVYLAGTLVCVWVWRAHHAPGRALWGFGTMMASWLIANVSKLAFQRARPVVEDALVHAGGTSFPSGHAFASAAGGTTTTLLLWPMLGTGGRIVTVTAATLFTLTTCADRILLGAHYPSDVVGGVLLGVTVPVASYVGYRGWSALRDDTPDPEV